MDNIDDLHRIKDGIRMKCLEAPQKYFSPYWNSHYYELIYDIIFFLRREGKYPC